MLSVLLLLSKYRLRNVPVIETGKSSIRNFITQSAVIQGLEGCKGRDWFDCISLNSISKLGLPFMTPDEVRLLRYLLHISVLEFVQQVNHNKQFVSILVRLLASEVMI